MTVLSRKPGASGTTPIRSRVSLSSRATELMLEISRSQYGLVTRRQLLDGGISATLIDERILASRLFVVYPGVYSVGRPVNGFHESAMAGVLACGPGAVICRQTAAQLWGFGNCGRKIQVVRAFNRRRRNWPTESDGSLAKQMLFVHRTRYLPPEDIELVDGIPVTSVSRVFLDLAAVTDDRQLQSRMTEAGRQGLLDIDSLRAITKRGPGRRGIGRLRAMIEYWNPGQALSKSNLESKFLDLCSSHDITAPEVNLVVAGLEIDCFWESSNFAVELDGYRFHGDRVAFERDRQRDVTLGNEGISVMRVTDQMMNRDPESLMRSVRDRLTRSS